MASRQMKMCVNNYLRYPECCTHCLTEEQYEHYLLLQVVIEGEIGKGTGGIAVDDIKIDNHVAQEDCRSEYE